MKLGDFLLKKRYITKKQLKDSLAEQSKQAIQYNKPVQIGKVLIEKGYVSVDEIAEALNEQNGNGKEEERVMPTEIGEGSKFTFDLKFLITIGVVIVSACATYFSITGQVDDNAKEISNIKSMGDLKIISYKLDEYDKTFEKLGELTTKLSPLASDLQHIKVEIEKLKNKKMDMPEVDLSNIENKLDELGERLETYETRLTKVEKSTGGRF